MFMTHENDDGIAAEAKVATLKRGATRGETALRFDCRRTATARVASREATLASFDERHSETRRRRRETTRGAKPETRGSTPKCRTEKKKKAKEKNGKENRRHKGGRRDARLRARVRENLERVFDTDEREERKRAPPQPQLDSPDAAASYDDDVAGGVVERAGTPSRVTVLGT